MDYNYLNCKNFNEMLKKLILYIVLISWIPVFAGNNGWIKETVTHTINTNFNEALHILNQRVVADSKDYRAQFYLAATLNSN